MPGAGWAGDGFLLATLGHFGIPELEYLLEENELKMKALSEADACHWRSCTGLFRWWSQAEKWAQSGLVNFLCFELLLSVLSYSGTAFTFPEFALT